ncbi:MAG: GNAT family N-acetyltransferase [Candidatus Eisenbacteria bacterium]
MESTPKTVRLRDGTEVLLRPLAPADLERSHRFFLSLPEDDRLCLRMDPSDIENVRMRMERSDARDHWRIVALVAGDIVADAALHQPRYGWMRHTAELRCIVARPYRVRGLGSMLFAELYQEATRRRIEKLYGLVPREQTAAVRVSEKLGFRSELVLSDHLRAREGELKDVLVMTVNIHDLWRRLEDLMQAMDGRGRECH